MFESTSGAPPAPSSAYIRGAAYESFDAHWCPYHVCQAGCSDVRRMCDSPREIVAAELSVGPRGGFESIGERPRRSTSVSDEGMDELAKEGCLQRLSQE